MELNKRAGALLAVGAGLLGLLILAGCAKEPKGQVVAIVNGREISKEQIAAELQDFPIPETVDRKKLRDTVLQGVIDRELEVGIAREKGLDKTPEFKRLKQRNEEDLLAIMLGHKLAQMVSLPAENEIRAYAENHPLQFARRQRLLFDQLSFPAPKDRRRLTAALANVHSMAEAAAALQSIGIVVTPGQGVIDTGLSEPALATALDRAPAGEPILLPQGDRLAVGVIVGREPIAMSKDDSYVAAARAVRAASLLRESQAQIAAARSTAQIHYEPGWAPDAAAKPR